MEEAEEQEMLREENERKAERLLRRTRTQSRATAEARDGEVCRRGQGTRTLSVR